MDSYIELYGSVKLVKMRCGYCRRMSIVVNGAMLCCMRDVQEIPTGYHRESMATGRRKPPPFTYQQQQLAIQQNRCFYCDRVFGTFVYRGPRRMVLRIHWDHMLPFAYIYSSPAHNFVAACHICNSLKGDFMFRDIEEAQEYVKRQWFKKEYRDTYETLPESSL